MLLTAQPADELRLKLAMQRAFVPWGSKGTTIKLPLAPPPSNAGGDEALAPGVEPLQLWPLDGDALPEGAKPVMVDNMLVKWLRPHQREGCVRVECPPLARCIATHTRLAPLSQGAIHVRVRHRPPQVWRPGVHLGRRHGA